MPQHRGEGALVPNRPRTTKGRRTPATTTRTVAGRPPRVKNTSHSHENEREQATRFTLPEGRWRQAAQQGRVGAEMKNSTRAIQTRAAPRNGPNLTKSKTRRQRAQGMHAAGVNTCTEPQEIATSTTQPEKPDDRVHKELTQSGRTPAQKRRKVQHVHGTRANPMTASTPNTSRQEERPHRTAAQCNNISRA